MTRPSYVAIAGAVDRLDQAGLFRESRMTTPGGLPISASPPGVG